MVVILRNASLKIRQANVVKGSEVPPDFGSLSPSPFSLNTSFFRVLLGGGVPQWRQREFVIGEEVGQTSLMLVTGNAKQYMPEF